MRRWQRFRERLLEEGERLAEAGLLDEPGDVFGLRGSELGNPAEYRQFAREAKARQETARQVAQPLTTDLDTLTESLQKAEKAQGSACDQHVFVGIGLTGGEFAGQVQKADDLVALLERKPGLGPATVLVVPALEPSWAVLFPRIGAVIAEVGGELSHASILLREAGKPAVVNVAGIFARLRDGDRVRLDGRRGRVEVLLREGTPQEDRPGMNAPG
jgi:pyruvate,water dikinase